MKKSLKICLIALLVVFMAITLSGCTKHSNKSLTFDVETGDRIQIKLNTANKYDITMKAPFEISKNEKKIAEGKFIPIDVYDSYKKIIEDEDAESVGVELIEKNENSSVEYEMFSYNNGEGNAYIIKIKDSNTGIYLEGKDSKESLKECFGRLEFSKE